MKLLIVAATRLEIQPLLSALSISGNYTNQVIGNHFVTVVITGVGMVSTAYSLGKHFAESSYDLAINLGIAGSFDFNLKKGDVCLVSDDTFAELGAEDGEDFLTFDKIGLGIATQSHRPNPGFTTDQLKEVTAITVNKVHGLELSIAKTIARFNPQIESMEGAAFFYACNQAGVYCIQIRAISNHVERRNRENWDINLAIKNLNETIIELLEK